MGFLFDFLSRSRHLFIIQSHFWLHFFSQCTNQLLCSLAVFFLLLKIAHSPVKREGAKEREREREREVICLRNKRKSSE